MNIKHFLTTQINDNGEETGEVKIFSNVEEVIRYVSQSEESENRKGIIEQTLKNMNCNDFEVIAAGNFIYEVDCMNDEDYKQIASDNEDLIVKDVDVFEICDGKTVSKVFGIDGLEKKLASFGIAGDDINVAISELSDKDFASISLTDPKIETLTIDKLSSRDVSKLEKSDTKFALEYNTARKMVVENVEEKIRYEIEFSVPVALDAQNALNDNPFICDNVEWTYTNTIEFSCAGEDDELYRDIIERLEDVGIQEDEYVITELSSSPSDKFRIDESTKRILEDSDGGYCGFQIKIEDAEDGTKSCNICKNGKTIITVGGFNSDNRAIAAAKFRIDSGKLSESTDELEGICEIEFLNTIVQDVKNALNDNPFVRHNIEWVYTNVIAFDYAGDDDELYIEIIECLEDADISKDEYVITKF